MDKKKVIWAVLFVFIAGASIWAVMSQAQSFSVDMFCRYIEQADVRWLYGGIACMFGYVVFEGLAIYCIIDGLGYRRKFRSNIVYSSADIYFSAITPSATGGQPASAYFMVKDGVPPAVVTVSLLVNLIMYTAAILVIGLVCILICPYIFVNFNLISRILVVVGYIVIAFLGIVFMLLLFRKSLLERICNRVLKFLDQFKLIRNRSRKKKKLEKTMEDFRQCTDMVAGQRTMLWKAFLYNLLQRMSQLMVTVMVYMASGGSFEKFGDVFATQSLVVIGSNCAPIPGAMGVADYLMLDGFSNIVGDANVANLELLSRSLSFYVLIIVSGIVVLTGYILRKIKRRNV